MQSYLWGMVQVSAECQRFEKSLAAVYLIFILPLFLSSCKGKSATESMANNQMPTDSIQPTAQFSIYDQALKWAEQGDQRILPLCDSLLEAPDKQAGAATYYYLGIYYAEIKDTVKSLAFF